MSKHTPEPWKVVARPGLLSVIGAERPDFAVAFMNLRPPPDGEEEERANAERIVACVNACEEIDPETIPALLEALRFIMGQRPGSAQANKEGLRERLHNIFASARLAIAKAESND